MFTNTDLRTTLLATRQRRSGIGGFFRRFAKHRLGVAGAAILVVLLGGAILAPLITNGNPELLDFAASRQAPSAEHWLGTDLLGRDVWSQLWYGARTSLYIAIVAALIEGAIGVALGAIAGYVGGWFDKALVKLTELIMTFPSLILILIMVGLLGPGVNNLIIVFVLTGWMAVFRIVRQEFLSVREETFVEVNRSLGLPTWRLIFRHMLPSTMSPIIVAVSMNIAGYVLAEAGLSFLGLGVPPTTPTWGNMLAAAQSVEVLQYYWWLWVTPMAVIVLFVTAVYLIGDALRDVLDPRK